MHQFENQVFYVSLFIGQIHEKVKTSLMRNDREALMSLRSEKQGPEKQRKHRGKRIIYV